MDITGAHVLITGGSRGIGAGLAKAFHTAGGRVTLSARSADALTSVAQPLDAHTIVADLTDTMERRSLVARAEDAQGPVDILVNNAGWEATGRFVGMTADDLDRIMVLNALVPAELCRQALPGMIQRGNGHIVNISSLAGCGVLPGLVPYSATKAALTHFSAGLRIELHGLPVGTTVVEVGLVKPTEMMDRGLAYEPTRAAFRRFYRLGLLRDTSLDRLCDAVIGAVTHDRRHVRLPRRATLFSLLPEAPRRMTEWILSGVRRRL
jgi:uncharacterized protein